MTGVSPQAASSGNGLPLQNIDADGQYPAERIPEASDARQIVATLIQSNRERARLNASVKGMFDGNRPYDQNKLKNAGRSWSTNVNWLEGSAKLSTAMVSFYDLFSGSPHYCEILTDFGDNPDQKAEWSRILTEEVDKTFKEWDGFDFNMNLAMGDMVAYGKGFQMWNDLADWRFTAVGQSRFLFPDGTESFPGKWEVVAVRQSFRVNELANFIRDEKAATAAGWNVQAVKDAIFNATPKLPSNVTTLYDYNYVQQQIKDHDVMWGIRCKTVQAAHVYVREFSGKVSHLIITEEGYKSNAGHASDTTDFLFKSVGRYDKFYDVICPFIFETVDGSVNGTQGLGHKIYGPMQAKNRLICSAVDLAFMRTGITLQANNAASLQKLSMVQIGSFNIIPPDFSVQQSTIMGDMDSPLKANRALDIMLDNNTGIYRNEGQKEEGNPRTFGEVKLQYMNTTVLANSSVNRFCQSLDFTYDICVRRIFGSTPKSSNEGMESARKCKERCIARGVPKEVFTHISSVKAYRPAGNGSPFMRQQSVIGLASFAPMFPETGKQAWLADVVATSGNQQMVDRYLPKSATMNLPTDQQNEAMLENSAIKIGAPVTWTPTQNNVVHAQTHLQAAAGASQSLTQGANPADVLAFMHGIGAHVAYHLEALKGDPLRKQQYAALEQQWRQLGKLSEQLQAHVQQMQQQQAQAQQQAQEAQQIAAGQDPKSQVLFARAHQQLQIDNAKATQHLTNNQLKAQQKARQAQQDMALKDAQTAADITRKNALAQATPQPVG